MASTGAAGSICTEPTTMSSPGILRGSRNTLASPSRWGFALSLDYALLAHADP
jgi:hypothetical protein